MFDPRISDDQLQRHRENIVPPELRSDAYERELARTRSGCLTLWIAAMLIGTGISGLALVGQMQAFSAQLANPLERISFRLLTGWDLETFVTLFILGSAVLIVMRLIAVAGIWHWRRWGLRWYIAGCLLNPVLTVIIADVLRRNDPYLLVRELIAFVVQVTILWVLLEKKWRYYT